MDPKILIFALTAISTLHPVRCYQDLFDIELFQRMAGRGTSNVLISPVGLKLLLAMIYEGAVDETAEEIRSTLRLPQQRDAATEKIQKWMTALTRKSGSDVIKVGFHIFLDQEYTLKSGYRTSLKQYNADIAVVDRRKPMETSRMINDWVKKETSGLIPSIMSPRDVDPSFVMAEANVIYFKGTWKYSFKKEDTKKGCFYKNGKNDCKEVDMMSMSNVRIKSGYIKALDARAVDLKYKDGEHSMFILLPEKRNGVDRLVHDLLMNNLDCIISRLYYTNINLKIPKFSVEYENRDVISILKSMNISRVFTKTAQLYNMVDQRGDIHLSDIFHKTKITVSEEGTEAAVASLGTTLLVKSLDIGTSDFIADHPFLYFITDEENIPLFAGKYNGP